MHASYHTVIDEQQGYRYKPAARMHWQLMFRNVLIQASCMRMRKLTFAGQLSVMQWSQPADNMLRPISKGHLHDESLHAKQLQNTEQKPLSLSQEG